MNYLEIWTKAMEDRRPKESARLKANGLFGDLTRKGAADLRQAFEATRDQMRSDQMPGRPKGLLEAAQWDNQIVDVAREVVLAEHLPMSEDRPDQEPSPAETIESMAARSTI